MINDYALATATVRGVHNILPLQHSLLMGFRFLQSLEKNQTYNKSLLYYITAVYIDAISNTVRDVSTTVDGT